MGRRHRAGKTAPARWNGPSLKYPRGDRGPGLQLGVQMANDPVEAAAGEPLAPLERARVEGVGKVLGRELRGLGTVGVLVGLEEPKHPAVPLRKLLAGKTPGELRLERGSPRHIVAFVLPQLDRLFEHLFVDVAVHSLDRVDDLVGDHSTFVVVVDLVGHLELDQPAELVLLRRVKKHVAAVGIAPVHEIGAHVARVGWAVRRSELVGQDPAPDPGEMEQRGTVV